MASARSEHPRIAVGKAPAAVRIQWTRPVVGARTDANTAVRRRATATREASSVARGRPRSRPGPPAERTRVHRRSDVRAHDDRTHSSMLTWCDDRAAASCGGCAAGGAARARSEGRPWGPRTPWRGRGGSGRLVGSNGGDPDAPPRRARRLRMSDPFDDRPGIRVRPGRPHREAHVPAEQPSARPQARVPRPHAHPRRAGDPQGSPPSRPGQAVGLSLRVARDPGVRCGGLPRHGRAPALRSGHRRRVRVTSTPER